MLATPQSEGRKGVGTAAKVTSTGVHSRSGKSPAHAESRLARLQSTHGNQHLQRLLGRGVLQTKLTVNQPGDVFEQEADRVADQVMRMTATGPPPAISVSRSAVGTGASLRRSCSCGGACEDCQRTSDVVHRASASSVAGGGTAPPVVHEVLRSPGQPLDVATRNFMEPRFGRDLGHVRVHTGPLAAESAASVDALAYTVAQHVVFGPGQYSPETTRGRRLLSHELAHVVQQSGDSSSLQRTCGESDIATKVGARGGCTDNFDKTFLAGLPLFKFNIGCDEFVPGQDTALTSFVAGLPATTTLEIHGFASSDGSKSFNENLGCARASAAFSSLTTASPGFAGISSSRITAVINHGPVRAGANPVANLRSVVIRTTGAPGPRPVPPTPPAPGSLQTVTLPPHIRGTATPAAMVPDRIPPRVDTPVDITFGGTPDPSAPVTLSIDGAGGGNGSATIDGSPQSSFAVSGTQSVKLRGVSQTALGSAGHLKLVARQHGTLLAESNGFSVSSIPQNMSHPFDRLLTDADCTSVGLAAGCGLRGMLVDQNMDSDSGVPADLDQAQESERIQVRLATGIFAGATPNTGCYVSCTPSPPDANGSGGLAGASSSGVFMTSQTFMFRDNRTGASEVPMTRSGFIITLTVAPKPGSGILGFFQDFQLTTSSIGTATSSTDPNKVCPSGTITSAAGITSVTKTQDL